MKRLIAITALFLLTLLALVATLLVSPRAQADGAYPHWQWHASTCRAGLSWAYGDQQEPWSGWVGDWQHNHAWTGTGNIIRRTEGNMQAEWAARGWECSWLGGPLEDKIQWHDAGRLVQRQKFGTPTGSRFYLQLVYRDTSYWSSYTVYIWATT